MAASGSCGRNNEIRYHYTERAVYAYPRSYTNRTHGHQPHTARISFTLSAKAFHVRVAAVVVVCVTLPRLLIKVRTRFYARSHIHDFIMLKRATLMR